MTLAEPRNRKWTRGEYHRIAEMGFFAGQRVELIEGEIIEMAPQRDVHAIVIGAAREAVAAVFASGYWIREQLPLALGSDSEPEPDLSVVTGKPRDYLGHGHPRDAALMIEVSDTTLKFDRSSKASLYAASGVQGYWIVNLLDLCVEVHRKPVSDARQPNAHRYSEITVYRSGEVITPLAKPDRTIVVADLLP